MISSLGQHLLSDRPMVANSGKIAAAVSCSAHTLSEPIDAFYSFGLFGRGIYLWCGCSSISIHSSTIRADKYLGYEFSMVYELVLELV